MQGSLASRSESSNRLVTRVPPRLHRSLSQRQIGCSFAELVEGLRAGLEGARWWTAARRGAVIALARTFAGWLAGFQETVGRTWKAHSLIQADAKRLRRPDNFV